MLNVVSVVGNRFDPRNDAQNGHIEFAGEFFIIAQTGIRSVDDNDGNTGDDKGNQADDEAEFNHFFDGLSLVQKFGRAKN